LGIGIAPLKRRRTRESIPWTLRQDELRIFMNRFEKWRANFFVRFFTIVGFVRGATFVIFLCARCD